RGRRRWVTTTTCPKPTWPTGPTSSRCCRTRPWPASWPTTRRSPSGPTSWSPACPTWTPPTRCRAPPGSRPARRGRPAGRSCTSSPRPRSTPATPTSSASPSTAPSPWADDGWGSGLEDHPAGDASSRLGAVRLDGLGERVHAADLGAQVALVDQAGELSQLNLLGLLDEEDLPDVVPVGGQIPRDHRDQPSAGREQGGRPGEHLAADHVEHHVGLEP